MIKEVYPKSLTILVFLNNKFIESANSILEAVIELDVLRPASNLISLRALCQSIILILRISLFSTTLLSSNYFRNSEYLGFRRV